jgi:hypothetical protein
VAPKSELTTTPEQRRVTEESRRKSSPRREVTRDEDQKDELLQLRKIKITDLEKLPGEK